MAGGTAATQAGAVADQRVAQGQLPEREMAGFLWQAHEQKEGTAEQQAKAVCQPPATRRAERSLLEEGATVDPRPEGAEEGADATLTTCGQIEQRDAQADEQAAQKIRVEAVGKIGIKHAMGSPLVKRGIFPSRAASCQFGSVQPI